HRFGMDLKLELRVEGSNKIRPWVSRPGDPRKVFAEALAYLDAPMADDSPVLPRASERFWDLVEGTGNSMEQDPTLMRTLVENVVTQEPNCAGGWATLAALSYWQLFRKTPTLDDGGFHECEAFFRKAFQLVPGYPRAVDDYCGFKTDLGDPREALEATFAAIKRYPRVPHLRGALAYPARMAGLLEGATNAIRVRDQLGGTHRFERDTVENTYLYLGDWSSFERLLGASSSDRVEPSRDFYRGYIRLIQGRRDEALTHFVHAQKAKGNWIQFETLAGIYELALTGKTEEALQQLYQFRAERALLKVPDGEFTFKLAEAFAFLGNKHEALETALRAHAQGFGCTVWYERSPLLANVPREARWNFLLQHMNERQALMEQSFPARRFRE
ncbi:MAG: hypothetical protein LWX11_07050, partial [Firmicutes bacterium]|nr:hypothetical protein [Bacillota bacterium]